MATPAPIAAGAATMAIPAPRRTQDVTANALATYSERLSRATCARASPMEVTPGRAPPFALLASLRIPTHPGASIPTCNSLP